MSQQCPVLTVWPAWHGLNNFLDVMEMMSILLLCFLTLSKIITVNPALVTSSSPGHEGCIAAGELTKLHAAISDQLSEIASGHTYDTK
jgi:hypothetical protein